MTFANGDRYEGEFKKGKMHGVGRCITSGIEGPCTFFEGERLD